MKYIFLFLLNFFSCGKVPAKFDHVLIFESMAEEDKTIPILIIGTRTFKLDYGYSIDFVVSASITKQILNCVYDNSDTFMIKPHPLYTIRSVANNEKVFYINNPKQLRSLFQGIVGICNKNNLSELLVVLDTIMRLNYIK